MVDDRPRTATSWATDPAQKHQDTEHVGAGAGAGAMKLRAQAPWLVCHPHTDPDDSLMAAGGFMSGAPGSDCNN